MEYIAYGQNYDEWKNIYLGNSKTTINDYGCLLTCMAMACKAFGFEETPLTLNTKLLTVNGFVGNLVIPSALGSLYPGITVLSSSLYPNDAAPITKLNNWLEEGNIVVIQLDSDDDPGLQSHWCILKDTKSSDDYVIIDAWDGKEKGLIETYGKKIGSDSASIIITGHLVYHYNGSTTEKDEEQKIEITGRREIISDGLNVRSGPGVDNSYIYMLQKGDIVNIIATQDNWAQLEDGNWICERVQYTKVIE
jgi:hypothetical protein